MGAVWQYAPNVVTSHYAVAGTTWVVLALNNSTNVVTPYATLALLHQNEPTTGLEWPNRGTYTNLQYVGYRTENGSGADGAPFYIAFNKAVAPVDDDAMLVSGSGQVQYMPGPIHNVWVRKTVSTDEVILTGGF